MGEERLWWGLSSGPVPFPDVPSPVEDTHPWWWQILPENDRDSNRLKTVLSIFYVKLSDSAPLETKIKALIIGLYEFLSTACCVCLENSACNYLLILNLH